MHVHYGDSCHLAIVKVFLVANFLTSNVFFTVRCGVCSVIASESKVSVVVTEITIDFPWAFTTICITVINKVGLNKI